VKASCFYWQAHAKPTRTPVAVEVARLIDG
jgi:hypothetical protein